MKNEFFIKNGIKKNYCEGYRKEKASASVMIVHGLGEHIGRYEKFAYQMNDSGFSVYGVDHYGHGKSSGSKGHTSIEEIFEELDILYNKILEENPGNKVAVFGHSLGGLIAVRYLQENADKFYSAAISAPAVKMAKEKEDIILKNAKIAKILPFIKVNNEIKNEDLSRNKKICDEYATDPLVHGKISLKLALSIYNEGKKAFEKVNSIKIPILIMGGTADKIVPFEGTQEFYNKLSSPNKLIIPYNGAYHETIYDPEYGENYRKDIIGWFRRYL